MKQVNLMHVTLIGGLFVYIGDQKQNTPLWAYAALGTLALMIPFIVRIPKDGSYRSLVNAAHYLFQLPILLYIAQKKNKSPPGVYPIMKALGIIMVVLHLYILYRKGF
jgi:hypothetical protein